MQKQHRDGLLKATVVGGEARQQSLAAEETDIQRTFTMAGAIVPPYDPEELCHWFEASNALRPNVDAYATNIDGFGNRLEPAIDLDAEDARRRIADCIFVERLAAQGRDQTSTPAEPTDEEIDARMQDVRTLARRERARLDAFFEFCCFDHSFVKLRRRTRQDLEVTGNAYWEVLRNGWGDIARLVYVPSHTVRLLPLDRDATVVPERFRVSPLTLDTVEIPRRLRRYVQVQGGVERVYFKAFGDPRVISRNTGQVFDPRAEGDVAATEMLHFAIESPASPYGVPRWVGALISVMGSRSSEEVNYLYFDNKTVPPLALIVSEGRLSDKSVPRIERFIEENLKGRKNFHKILILEAEGGDEKRGSRAKIELRPLTDAQQQDALFQKYDERNIDKVGMAFRMPQLMRGDSREFNRSVADAQLRFAEDQVFQPERDEFDHLINRRLLADMGIRFWRFRSQTPVTRDPERMSVMIERLVRVGVLTPEEGRTLASDVFNHELRKIGDDWVKRPITLTLAGIQTGVEDLRGNKGDLLSSAKGLINLREQLVAEETRLQKERLRLAREYQRPAEAERVTVPNDEFTSWFEDDDTHRGKDA